MLVHVSEGSMGQEGLGHHTQCTRSRHESGGSLATVCNHMQPCATMCNHMQPLATGATVCNHGGLDGWWPHTYL